MTRVSRTALSLPGTSPRHASRAGRMGASGTALKLGDGGPQSLCGATTERVKQLVVISLFYRDIFLGLQGKGQFKYHLPEKRTCRCPLLKIRIQYRFHARIICPHIMPGSPAWFAGLVASRQAVLVFIPPRPGRLSLLGRGDTWEKAGGQP